MENLEIKITDERLNELLAGFSPALIENFFKELDEYCKTNNIEVLDEKVVIKIIEKIKINETDIFRNTNFKLYFPYEIKGTLNDIIGYEEIKEELLQVKEMYEKKEEYKKYGIKLDMFNIIFAGFPGTGKSKLAGYLAKEIKVPIIYGSANIGNSYVNSGVQEIKKIFEQARYISESLKTPVVLFIDEAQEFVIDRKLQKDTEIRKIQNQLLVELDGLNKKDLDIILILSSNFSRNDIQIDEAINRRFNKKIFFRLPTKPERIEIIKYFLNKIPEELLDKNNINIEQLAEFTTDLSPALIEQIFEEVKLTAIRTNKKIDDKLLLDTIEIILIGRPDKKMLSKEKIEMKKRIARHEVGHFIIHFVIEMLKKDNKFNSINDIEQYIFDNKYNINKNNLSEFNTLKISIKPVLEVNALGYHWTKNEENYLKTKLDLEQKILELYGGLTAERYWYNKQQSLGCFDDLQKINKNMKILYQLGFYDSSYFYIEENDIDTKELKEIAKKYFDKSMYIIEHTTELQELLYQELIKKDELVQEDIIKILNNYFKKR